MVKLIIIGKGNHVIKNILPAVERSRKVLVKGFIDKNNTYHCNITGSTSFVDDMFYLDNKETYFYIATPIASHFLLCKNLLQRGLNVICEKLLVEREMEAKELFSLTNGNTHLHEVCMYKYHKAFDYIMQYVVDNKSKIKEISADFKIPALPEGDFRYNKSLGGGAINDIGFYPISFLESLPISDKKIYSTNYFIDSTQNIDTEGSIILLADNVKLIANWALGQEYKNSIRILEDEKVILVERFFLSLLISTLRLHITILVVK